MGSPVDRVVGLEQMNSLSIAGSILYLPMLINTKVDDDKCIGMYM